MPSALSLRLHRRHVHELASAGMSTRAIAPVVGTGLATVHRDLHSGVPGGTPAVNVEPFDLFDEIRAVSAEALRLAREGGSVEERAAFDERKARVIAELEGAARATDRAKGALRDRGAS